MSGQVNPDLRDLIERNAQIQEMTQHPGWALLEDYMRAQMGAKQRSLLLGNADTIEEYREWTGWLKGVSATLDAPDTLAKQLEREAAQDDAQAAG